MIVGHDSCPLDNLVLLVFLEVVLVVVLFLLPLLL